jgi:uncharacterized protein (TIGR03435 family)
MKEAAEVPVPKDDGDAAPPPPPLPMQPRIGPDGFPILPLGGRAGQFMVMMNGRARFIGRQQTMQDLAGRLTNQLSRPATDATALKAKYDFTLTFSPEGMNGPMGPLAYPKPNPSSTFSEPCKRSSGSNWSRKKGPLELILIDHVEKTPTGNQLRQQSEGNRGVRGAWAPACRIHNRANAHRPSRAASKVARLSRALPLS